MVTINDTRGAWNRAFDRVNMTPPSRTPAFYSLSDYDDVFFDTDNGAEIAVIPTALNDFCEQTGAKWETETEPDLSFVRYWIYLNPNEKNGGDTPLWVRERRGKMLSQVAEILGARFVRVDGLYSNRAAPLFSARRILEVPAANEGCPPCRYEVSFEDADISFHPQVSNRPHGLFCPIPSPGLARIENTAEEIAEIIRDLDYSLYETMVKNQNTQNVETEKQVKELIEQLSKLGFEPKKLDFDRVIQLVKPDFGTICYLSPAQLWSIDLTISNDKMTNLFRYMAMSPNFPTTWNLRRESCLSFTSDDCSPKFLTEIVELLS